MQSHSVVPLLSTATASPNERQRASELGYPDPICSSYQETSHMYEACLEAAFEAMKSRAVGAVSIMAATHNEETVKMAVNK
ncbi:unnamed protein product [Protopolystoma xenopodis]|uniref:Proline dehydrogenase n=1 Tax=Protopolystoma xenopodis TaxID=117903 RepID=A0A3S5AM69_9PLAT|nr:unnamed protein product [Protopolystoma xenopodis]